jgi:hypothetical protein
MVKGEEVQDDLSDLADPALLAELAQTYKLAEAAAAANDGSDHDDDPYGAGEAHESGAPACLPAQTLLPQGQCCVPDVALGCVRP